MQDRADVRTPRPRVALKEYTRLLLLRREKMHGAGGCLSGRRLSGPAATQLAERLSRRRYLFTFQMQSLFDASLPGTPHFVYTDQAELQSLRFPGFSPKQLFPPRWIRQETCDLREREHGLHDERRHTAMSRG